MPRISSTPRGNAGELHGDINTVFACLASNLGTAWAAAKSTSCRPSSSRSSPGTGQQRCPAPDAASNAYLGLVFLTDEDDCSAYERRDVRRQSGSLRAGRVRELALLHASHHVQRQEPHPTRLLAIRPRGLHRTPHVVSARTDACPSDRRARGTDTSVPTSCSPLKRLQAPGRTKSRPSRATRKSDPRGRYLRLAARRRRHGTAQYKIDLDPQPEHRRHGPPHDLRLLAGLLRSQPHARPRPRTRPPSTRPRPAGAPPLACACPPSSTSSAPTV
jgi:hypothetical protein